MYRHAPTERVNLAVEIGAALESGKGFASKTINSGDLGKATE